VPAINIVGGFLATFKDYPPCQASGTLSVEKSLTMLQEGPSRTDLSRKSVNIEHLSALRPYSALVH
jgi:hypothetical protein